MGGGALRLAPCCPRMGAGAAGLGGRLTLGAVVTPLYIHIKN